MTNLLEWQSDSIAEHLDQLPWRQLLLWRVGDTISWLHKMPGADYVLGTSLLSGLHRNTETITDGWKTQKPEKKVWFSGNEEWVKRKMFFSHTAGILGLSVQGGGWRFRSHGFLKKYKVQFICCHQPLPDLPCPPILEVLRVFFSG